MQNYITNNAAIVILLQSTNSEGCRWINTELVETNILGPGTYDEHF